MNKTQNTLIADFQFQPSEPLAHGLKRIGVKLEIDRASEASDTSPEMQAGHALGSALCADGSWRLVSIASHKKIEVIGSPTRNGTHG